MGDTSTVQEVGGGAGNITYTYIIIIINLTRSFVSANPFTHLKRVSKVLSLNFHKGL